MSRRNGYTLVECLVVIALIGTAMTTVAVAMSGMHRAGQRVRAETAVEMDLQRFAVQLRADAHEALSAEQEDGDDDKGSAPTLRLTLRDDETVRYTVGEETVQRERRRGDERVHRETYRLPQAYTAHWELEESGLVPMVRMKLEPEPVELSSPMGTETIQIDAAVGVIRRRPAQPKL